MARRTPPVPVVAAACLLALLAPACGAAGPTTPSPQSAVVVSVSGWLAPLGVGQSVQLTATATLADGTTRSVTTEAVWESSNSSVAIVSPAGLVVGQAAGRVDIRARYDGRLGVLGLSVVGSGEPPGMPPGLICGVERWAVKTLSDGDADRVDLSRVQQTTIRALNERASHCSGLPVTRAFDEELQVYEVTGRVIFVRLEDDRDYHVALADPSDAGYTIVTEVADIACQGAISSPHRGALESARNAFISLLGGRVPSSLVGTTVRLQGVGFFDFAHGQIGRSRNCMELHPALSIVQQ